MIWVHRYLGQSDKLGTSPFVTLMNTALIQDGYLPALIPSNKGTDPLFDII